MVFYFRLLFLTIVSVTLVAAETIKTGNEAQKPAQASVDDVAYLAYLLDLKVTSGSFLELDLETSPFSMTIITRDQIRMSGARTMSELLEIHVPGFQYMFNKWRGTLWGMRGIANDRNTKIIVSVNGHKLNTQGRDGFQGETVLGLLGDIERVEVLRGPAGLVYGSGAIAGIINIVTRRAEGNTADITTTFATPGARQIDANLFATPSSDQSIAIAAGYRRSDGLPDHASRIYGSGAPPLPPSSGNTLGVPSDGNFGSTDGNWRFAADWSIKNLDLYFRVTRQKETAGAFFVRDPWPERSGFPDSTYPPRIVDNKIITWQDTFWSQSETFFVNCQQFLSDNISGQASYELPIRSNSMYLKAGYDGNTTRTGTETRNGYASDYFGVTVADFVPYTFGEHRFSASTLYLLKSVPNLQLAAGLEFRHDRIGEDLEGRNQCYSNSAAPVVTSINYTTVSLVTEGLYTLTDKFDLHFGGRLDRHTRAFMAMPKLALIYKPAQHHAVKLIGQSSSNNGSADNYEYNWFHRDLYTGDLYDKARFTQNYLPPGASTEIIQPVPPIDSLHKLRPERVYSAEIAYTGQLFDRITLAPSASFGYVKDLFGWSQQLFRVVNAGSYRYINLDIDGSFRSRYVTIGASHTYQRPVLTDPDREKSVFPIAVLDTSGGQRAYDSIPVSTSPTGWYYYPTSTTSADFDLNLVKESITADGVNFLNLNTHITKCFITITPFEWIALHADARIFWGLRGRREQYAADRGYNYPGIAETPADHGWYRYLKESVSKKVNVSLHFFLPHGFEASVFAYDILGIERPFDADSRDYVTNTIRWAYMYSPAEKELFSTDQRSFGIRLGKSF